MSLRTITAAAALAAGLIGATLATAAPALACGDTPGFCPNPPVIACHENGNINDCGD